MKKTLVMKFGGTSVGNAARILSSAHIVQEAAARDRIVVVVSALAGITDRILNCVKAAGRGEQSTVSSALQEIEARHEEVIASLFNATNAPKVREQVGAIIRQLHDLCFALVQLRSLTAQLLDVALPMGEKLSAQIFAAILEQSGTPSRYVDSTEILVTDDHFGDATADLDATRPKAHALIFPLLEQGRVPVVTGFSGATKQGQPTTLGRGGSDSSATILGAVLDSDEVWIWTDVDGVLSADPRICPDARVLPEISFTEAIELSYYGAKVIHHKAIRPTMDKKIPVWIKNSFRPEIAGTKVTGAPSINGIPVKAVTSVTKASLVTLVAQNDIYVAADILGRMFLRLGHDHVDILFSTQSSAENSLGLVVRGEDTDRVTASIERMFRTELRHGVLKSVDVERDLAVITVLGEAMKGSYGVIGRIFSAVGARKVSVTAVAQGASELSICFAVAAASAPDVIQAIHQEFFH
jgi:bifunctional aspartokinase / homoserine dehydrogenase 1